MLNRAGRERQERGDLVRHDALRQGKICFAVVSRFASALESVLLQPVPERNGRPARLSGAGSQLRSLSRGKRSATLRVVCRHSSR
jgi:hypothetical protein